MKGQLKQLTDSPIDVDVLITLNILTTVPTDGLRSKRMTNLYLQATNVTIVLGKSMTLYWSADVHRLPSPGSTDSTFNSSSVSA